MWLRKDPEMNPEEIEVIERTLGYTFKSKDLLMRAMIRKAFAQEQRQRIVKGSVCEDQELYRILGDAVLKVILVEMLIQRGYNSRESITKKKIDLESRESLGKMFERMNLKQFIRLGIGETKQGVSRHFSVLGETFEALIAAIHIDAGNYAVTKGVVINLFDEFSESLTSENPR